MTRDETTIKSNYNRTNLDYLSKTNRLGGDAIPAGNGISAFAGGQILLPPARLVSRGVSCRASQDREARYQHYYDACMRGDVR
jgi:hypothetical protein